MIRRRISVPALAVVAALTLVVGCSSSDSSDAKTTTASEGGSGSTTEADASGDGGGGGTDDIELSGDFCEKARQLESVGDDLFGDDTTDTSPEALLAGVQDLFRTLDDVYGQLKQDAPDEIADEIGLLADFASTNYEQVKDMTSYEEAAAVAQTAFGGDTESEEFQAASDKIGAYVEKECGIVQED